MLDLRDLLLEDETLQNLPYFPVQYLLNVATGSCLWQGCIFISQVCKQGAHKLASPKKD